MTLFNRTGNWSQLAISLLLTCTWLDPVVAGSVIKQAEIYKLRNQVELDRQNQQNWNPAQLGDTIVPLDLVRTGSNSRADLLFNEGTLVRTGSQTIFRFYPGRRSFELTSGAALMMIPPNKGASTIITPEAKITSQGTALFLQHDSELNSSLIGVLTDSPAGLVKVTDSDGKVLIQLQAGEFISIVNGVVGLVEHFVLPMFYDAIELASGLGIEEEETLEPESPAAQATIDAVRAEAIKPLKNQIAWLKGFCQFNWNSQSMLSTWQLLGLGHPQAQVNLELPESDLFVIPFRSVSGLVWLNNYCQENRELPKSDPRIDSY